MYNKLFSKLIHSSVWLETAETRCVWCMFIAIMDQDGFVALPSVANVAHAGRVTLEQAQEAINRLESPDPNSSSTEFEGRRIQRVPGGWLVLNAKAYSEIATREIMRLRTRERVARFRAQQRAQKESRNGDVTKCNASVTPSDVDAEVHSNTVPSKDTERGGKGGELFGAEAPGVVSAKKPRAVKTPFVKPTLEAWVAYAETVGLPKADAEGAYDHYETVGWVVGQARKPMKNWEAAVRTCKRNYEERRQSGGRPSQRPLSPEEVRKQLISGSTPSVDMRAVIARRKAEREAAESGRVGGEVAQAPAVVPPSAGHGVSDSNLGLDLGAK